MNKKGVGGSLSTLAGMVIVVIVIVFSIWFISKPGDAAASTISPALAASKVKACELISKGVNNIDGDDQDNSCDVCIDGHDSPANDKNGNFMSDLCEAKGSTSKKIICRGNLELDGVPEKNRCCTTDTLDFKDTGLGYTCKKNGNYADKPLITTS